jgi:Phage integrase family
MGLPNRSRAASWAASSEVGGRAVDQGSPDPSAATSAMRHTAASWLVQDGVSLYEVQALLGRELFVTTQRYAHLAPDAHPKVLESWSRRHSASVAHEGDALHRCPRADVGAALGLGCIEVLSPARSLGFRRDNDIESWQAVSLGGETLVHVG